MPKYIDSLIYMTSDNQQHYCNKFIIKGDKLFQYMNTNFENMFIGDETIKHFNIKSGRRSILYIAEDFFNEKIKDDYSYKMTEQFKNSILIECIPWIKNEFQTNRLIDKTHWRPFRDPDMLLDIFLGYKYIFQYKQYYFQLVLETECEIDDCIDCFPDKKNIDSIHFELAMWGWENMESSYGIFKPLSDTSMPDNYWEMK